MELIGRQFGHIRVTEVVGQGGMGEVYGGYDEKLERRVALKVLNSDQRLDEEARERLLREARALSRLDHANICRIHDYIESSDVDLLVLEYIDGRTLHEALSDGMPRSEKLRIATAIAQVLVTAHRAGIVHRDLKPENVMLTRSGEVKVLDFGLARWLNRARKNSSGKMPAVRVAVRGEEVAATVALPSAPARAVTSDLQFDETGRRQFLATAAGITLGTPIFMSPEQARGETLTPASDMYAFGLLLQTLFSGKDPHPPNLTAREVILRAARGETLPVKGVARDITSLITRLKQFAPTDRPTAVEALERLRFLADKPQRLARRGFIALIALVALVGAWRYTVDLKAERALAVAARSEAEHRRAQAEDLIEFMLGDLRKKLEPVGRLDILDDVGARALEYAQALDPTTMSVDELVRNSKALNQLGDVRIGQGKTPEALQMFGRSLTLIDAALKRDPKNAQVLFVHGGTHFYLGNGMRLQGNTPGALEHMRAYMKDGDALVQLDPGNKDYQLERAYGHSGVALVLEANGEYASALEHYRTSLAIKQELARRNPDDLDVQADVARAWNKVANVSYKRGELRNALTESQREVEIYRRLVARDPQQVRWKQRLATSIAFLTRTLEGLGDNDEALSLRREELEMERALASRDPSNVESQRAVAITLRWISGLMNARGDRRAAFEAISQARSLMQQVVKSAPTDVEFAVDHAQIDTEYGTMLSAGGDARGIEMIREAIRRVEALPPDRRARVQIARSAFALGEAVRAHDRAAAQRHYERAESELAPQLATSGNPLELDLWTRVLIRRGRAADARAILARLKTMGYHTSELERLCSENGC